MKIVFSSFSPLNLDGMQQEIEFTDCWIESVNESGRSNRVIGV